MKCNRRLRPPVNAPSRIPRKVHLCDEPASHTYSQGRPRTPSAPVGEESRSQTHRGRWALSRTTRTPCLHGGATPIRGARLTTIGPRLVTSRIHTLRRGIDTRPCAGSLGTVNGVTTNNEAADHG